MQIDKIISNLRIQTKLFIAMVGVVTVTIILIMVGVLRISKKSLVYQIDTNQRMSLFHIKNLIINNFSEINYKMAFVKKFEDVVSFGRTNFLKILLEETQKNQEFLSMIVFDKEDKVVERVAIADFDPDALKIVQDELYNKVKNKREAQLSEIKYINETPVVEIFYPIINYNCVYVLVDLSKLTKIIMEEEEIANSKIFLVNKNNEIVLSSISNYVGKRYKSSNLSGKVLNYDNKKVIVRSENINLNKDYYLVIEKDLRVLNQPLYTMILFVIGWIVVAIVVAFMISLIVSGYMIRPIMKLVDGVKSLSVGKFNNIEIDSNDEIGFLAKSFNQAVVEIKDLQNKLIDNERMATIGQMASMVGHEIRNPLSAIYMASSLLINDEKKIDVKKFASMIKQEAVVINKIAENLLGYARSRPPQKEKVNILELFNEISVNLKIPSKVKLENRIMPDIVIMAEQVEIRQVFINLVDNAIQAMGNKEGGVVTVEAVKVQNNKVRISIIDNGPGIAPEVLKKIFEPLFSTKPKGTGLGLAVVKRVVERHNGTIEVNSKVGEGTSFIITIPCG